MTFESWRREVNIILNQVLGYSLKDIKSEFDSEIQKMYNDGNDPLDAAQFVVNEIDNGTDVEMFLLELEMKKQKGFKKNMKMM
jgi:hypothetical protein